MSDNKKLRIALLSYRSKPHCGGQGVYVRHLSRELALLGHDVEIFSGQPYPELDQSALDAGVTVTKVPSLDLYNDSDPFRTPRLREFRDWIDLIEVGAMWTAGFGEPLTFSLRAARLLKARRADFDIVHDNQCLGYGLLRIQRFGFPLIATIHHPITRDRTLAVKAAKGLKKVTAWRWHSFLRMQGIVSRRIPELLTVSRSSEVDIRKAFDVAEDALTTIPLGVDTEVFRPGADRIPGRVVCVASADAPLKGVAYLLEAIAKVGAERPVELVLVSKLDPAGPSAKRIDELSICDRVRVVSGIDDVELADLLATAEIACVPSLYEGFSLPAVEAMGCGTPLVATRAGAIPEVVGVDEQAAILVPPQDSGALAAALTRLLDDPALRKRLGDGGRRRVEENYSWAAVAAKTAAHYQSVLDRLDKPVESSPPPAEPQPLPAEMVPSSAELRSASPAKPSSPPAESRSASLGELPSPAAEPSSPPAEPTSPLAEPPTPAAEPTSPPVEPPSPAAEPTSPPVEPPSPAAEPLPPPAE